MLVYTSTRCLNNIIIYESPPQFSSHHGPHPGIWVGILTPSISLDANFSVHFESILRTFRPPNRTRNNAIIYYYYYYSVPPSASLMTSPLIDYDTPGRADISSFLVGRVLCACGGDAAAVAASTAFIQRPYISPKSIFSSRPPTPPPPPPRLTCFRRSLYVPRHYIYIYVHTPNII